MKTTLTKLLLAAAATLPLSAQAVDPKDMFVGINYGVANISSDAVSGDSPDAGFVSLGYHFTSELAIEGRAGAGFELLRDAEDHDLDGIYGLYLRLQFPNEAPARLFALAGAGTARYSLPDNSSIKGSSFSFGGGIAIRYRDYAEWVFEAMRFDDEKLVDVDTYTMGFRFYY